MPGTQGPLDGNVVGEHNSVVIRFGSRRKTADDQRFAIAETVDSINND